MSSAARSNVKSTDEALSQLQSLNGEANTGRGVWIAFNSLMAYLAVSVIGVTHEDLSVWTMLLTLPIIGASIHCLGGRSLAQRFSW